MTFSLVSPSSDYGPNRLLDDYKDDDNRVLFDDAYMPMTSPRGGRRVRDNPSKHKRRASRGCDDFSVLQETSRLLNKSRLKSSFGRRGKKPDREGDGNSSVSSSAGILDMLKDDINSIERMKSKSRGFSDSHVSSRSTSPDRGSSREFLSSNSSRISSAMQLLNDDDSSESIRNIYASDNSRQSIKRINKKDNPKNDELMKKLNVLQLENELLHKSVRRVKGDSAKIIDQVKGDSVKIIEYNETKINEFSDVKSRLDRSKFKEAELERKLSVVTDNAESEKGRLFAELSTSRAKNTDLQRMFGDELSSVKSQLEKSKLNEAKLEKVLREVISNIDDERSMVSSELLTSRATNDDFFEKLQALKEENEQLQVTVRTVKDDSVKIIEHNERKLSGYSNVKLQLEESRSKEAELEETLHKAISKVERLSNESAAAHKMHRSETSLLKERLAEKTEDVQELESNMEQLQRSLDEDRDEIEDKMREKIERLEMSMKSNEKCWSKKIRMLEDELDTQRSDYSELEDKTRSISEELLKAEILNRRHQESFDRTKTEQEEQSIGLKKSLRETSEKLGNAIRQNHGLNTKLTNTTDENRKVTKRFSDLKTEHVSLKEATRKLVERVSNLEDENKSFKNIIDEKNEENIRVKSSLAEATESLKCMERELNNVKSLEGDTRKLERGQEEHTNALERKIATTEEEKQAQAVQIETLTATLAELKSKNFDIELALNSSNSTIRATTKTNAEMQTHLDNATKKIETLKAKVLSRDRQLVDMNKATELMHKTVHDLNANIAEDQKKATTKDQEISSLQSELSSTNKRLQKFKKQNTKLEKEAEELTSGLHDDESMLNDTIEALKTELIRSEKNLRISNDNLSEVSKENADRNDELQAALHSLDTMTKFVEHMREENDEVVASLEGDLEKAIKTEQNTKKEMKKRIIEERKKVAKGLETSRHDAMKDASKVNASYIQKMGEMRKMYDTGPEIMNRFYA